MPFIKVRPGPSRIATVPEVTEACLDGPGSQHFQVGLFEFTKRLGEGLIEVLANVKPIMHVVAEPAEVVTVRSMPDRLPL